MRLEPLRGTIACSRGTRKMRSIGFRPMIVTLDKPEESLTGKVVAGLLEVESERQVAVTCFSTSTAVEILICPWKDSFGKLERAKSVILQPKHHIRNVHANMTKEMMKTRVQRDVELTLEMRDRLLEKAVDSMDAAAVAEAPSVFQQLLTPEEQRAVSRMKYYLSPRDLSQFSTDAECSSWKSEASESNDSKENRQPTDGRQAPALATATTAKIRRKRRRHGKKRERNKREKMRRLVLLSAPPLKSSIAENPAGLSTCAKAALQSAREGKRNAEKTTKAGSKITANKFIENSESKRSLQMSWLNFLENMARQKKQLLQHGKPSDASYSRAPSSPAHRITSKTPDLEE
uniref:Uncharacterized protein n=1 Tax=Lotharella oceanica TaxID=641309 RepID=A0A7S2TQ86_9EUKA|mmetsp:Transcript_24969/g.46660  ORF Transcript_24969/g.46660 Transcript_24969/m.46660 type:complete len:347 (+) Transcript_24969:16-1056(+)